MEQEFEIFLAAPPGLEPVLADEARALGLAGVAVLAGGVSCRGGWAQVWRANLALRGAGRVLARIAEFRAMHPAQLDKRARKVDWAAVLPRSVPVRIEATSRKSRIYHAGAAASRVAGAMEAAGLSVVKEAKAAALTVMVRIEDDLCTISLDTSGEGLHKRGHKQAVGKAPLRETYAALLLRACGYDGRETVVDPMCGSGTIPIEAAEIAAGLMPGRGRGFAFETLPGFDADAFAALKRPPVPVSDARAFGSDRDAGAVRGAAQNAERASVGDRVTFSCHAVSGLQRPDGGPGLVLLNPPYGARIGNRKLLFGLYGALGKVLGERFEGWRVGFITTDDGLARATGLDVSPSAPIAHGGLNVKLWQARL